MTKTVYDAAHWLNCIEAETPIEEDVLRRAILPDAFDDLPGRVSELRPFHRKLLVTGGKVVADDAWCKDALAHYQLCERIATGWYSLRITFWHCGDTEELGGLTLRAALWTFPPLIQAPWLGFKRRFHCYPIWRIPEDGNLRLSGAVRLRCESPPAEHVFLLAVSRTETYEYFEWNPVVPHKFLVDPDPLTPPRT